jgi:hypothetical protein
MTMHGAMSVSVARPALEVTGREAELGLLATFLREDLGRPAALVLQGDAGIGKTTILRAALERAQPSDLRVLAIRLSGGEAELPFAALGDLIEEAGGEGLAALAPPQREAIEVALGRMIVLGVQLPRPRVELVHAASGGNPFFALELGREGLERPRSPVLSAESICVRRLLVDGR